MTGLYAVVSEHPFRSRLLAIGVSSSPQGIPEWVPTIAEYGTRGVTQSRQYIKDGQGIEDTGPLLRPTRAPAAQINPNTRFLSLTATMPRAAKVAKAIEAEYDGDDQDDPDDSNDTLASATHRLGAADVLFLTASESFDAVILEPRPVPPGGIEGQNMETPRNDPCRAG